MASRRQSSTGIPNALEQLEPRQLLAVNSPSPDFFPGGAQMSGIIAADFDGDQDLDIAAWRYRNGGQFRSTLFLLTNDGDGNFEVAVRRKLLLPPGEMAAGDFDGDGAAELATSASLTIGPSRVQVFSFNENANRLQVVARRRVAVVVDALATVRVAGSPDRLLIARTPFRGSFEISVGTFQMQDGRLVPDQPIFTGIAGVDGIRVVDADGDGNDDVLVARRTSTPREVSVNLYTQSAIDGSFAAAVTLLNYDSDSRVAPLLADIDHDGHMDVVYIATESGVDTEVHLRRSDGASGFLDVEVLNHTDSASDTTEHEILGYGPGPGGLDEIRIAETYGSGSDQHSSQLVRIVRESDGMFTVRALPDDGALPSAPRTGYIAAQFTDDTATDYLWIARFRRQLTLLRFRGGSEQPTVWDVSAFRAASLDMPASQIVTTGDTIVLAAGVHDLEEAIGEPGGLVAASYFLDVNGNGAIDAGDVLIGTPAQMQLANTTSVVGASWPRGTFNVLAQFTDASGLTTVGCTELPLTIV